MKKLQVYLMVALLGVAAACSLFKKDIEVPQDFNIKITQAATDNLAFTKTTSLDTQNDDVQKYQDDIDAFSISRVTYKVTQFSGTNTPVISGTLKFGAGGTSTPKVLGTISNLNLKASHDSGQEYTMDLASEAVRNELIDMIKAGNTIDFTLDAASDNNPVDATIGFKIYANMTVEL